MIRPPRSLRRALRFGGLGLLAAVPLALAGGVLGAGDTLTATLAPSQEVPPVSSTANGSGYLFVSADGTTISYTVSYQGLSGNLTGAEIAWGNAGTTGAPMFTLPVRTGTLFGQLAASDVRPASKTWNDALAALRAGAAYINLSSTGHPTGELRGQVKSAAGGQSASPRPSTASPSAEPPTDTEPGFGRGPNGGGLLPVWGILASAIGLALLSVAKVRPTPRHARDDARTAESPERGSTRRF